ncbi:hypothetical protein LINPERHAP1_LOCUS26921, partial [Linum perenne]
WSTKKQSWTLFLDIGLQLNQRFGPGSRLQVSIRVSGARFSRRHGAAAICSPLFVNRHVEVITSQDCCKWSGVICNDVTGPFADEFIPFAAILTGPVLDPVRRVLQSGFEVEKSCLKVPWQNVKLLIAEKNNQKHRIAAAVAEVRAI